MDHGGLWVDFAYSKGMTPVEAARPESRPESQPESRPESQPWCLSVFVSGCGTRAMPHQGRLAKPVLPEAIMNTATPPYLPPLACVTQDRGTARISIGHS